MQSDSVEVPRDAHCEGPTIVFELSRVTHGVCCRKTQAEFPAKALACALRLTRSPYCILICMAVNILPLNIGHMLR